MFSNPVKEIALAKMQNAQQVAKQFLQQADWLIITLGSSFAYKLTNLSLNNDKETFVANCHKAPSQWFEKYLIPIEEQIATLDQTIYRIRRLNPSLKIIFTVSPVRHIRDGVVENNRSKARLIETVHHLVQKFNHLYYFPAYEMVIDVLRDYRFYDIDMVHPNYNATNYVIEKFLESFVSKDANALLEKIKPIIIARKHKAFHPTSLAHKKFLLQNIDAVQQIQKEYPILNWEEELSYFSTIDI
jgi:hypothetical protein